MDQTILAKKRAEAHNRIFEVLREHATGETAERVETARDVYKFGRLEDLLEGYVIAEEVRALAEVVAKLEGDVRRLEGATATPRKAKAKS